MATRPFASQFGFQRHSKKQHISFSFRELRCEASPRRVARVTKLIEKEVGSMMLTDKILMDVTKTRPTHEDTKGALCSCSGVHVSSDLQVVKVYVSIFTEDSAARGKTLSRLDGLTGYVRRLIGERVRLRLTPEVRFVHDVAVERGERVLALLNKIKEGEGTEPAGTDESPVNLVLDQPEGHNPFLEGVGDPAYDSDCEDTRVTSVFSADMFPEPNLAEERLISAQKQDAWKQKNRTNKLRSRRKAR